MVEYPYTLTAISLAFDVALCNEVAELIGQNYFKLTNTRKSQDWMKTNIPDHCEKPCKVIVVT